MPFYFVASIWKKNGTKMDIALSQTGLKPARRERDVVDLHQPFHGPVKEYQFVQFPFVSAQSPMFTLSSVSSQSSAVSGSHRTSSSISIS